MSSHESFRRRWVTALSSTMLMGGAGVVLEQGRRWSANRRLDLASGGLVAETARVSAARIPATKRVPPPITTILPAHDRRHVITEQIFRDFLVREQKRAERFSEPFVLLLIGLEDEPTTVPTSQVWKAATDAVLASSRETDVVGWVTRGRVLGLVLTEITASEEAIALDVEARIRQELARRLDARTQAGLAVRLHFNVRTSTTAKAEGLWPSDPLLFDTPQPRRSKLRDGLKRAVDILGSATLLLLLSPVFAVIAALIKLKSPGPVFFRQVRVGEKAQPFTMLKFRSMHANADSKVHQQYVTQFIKSAGKTESGTSEVFKLTNDPRITPLGHFLRKTSLDELPQFWNVLRGDMSLVGPRPPLFYETEQYQPWHWRRVLDAKPGVTGLWQVAGRSRTTFDGMVRLDLRYVRTRSLWTDLKILLMTPAAVITGKGAC